MKMKTQKPPVAATTEGNVQRSQTVSTDDTTRRGKGSTPGGSEPEKMSHTIEVIRPLLLSHGEVKVELDLADLMHLHCLLEIAINDDIGTYPEKEHRYLWMLLFNLEKVMKSMGWEAER